MDTTHAASLRSPTPRSNTYRQTLADIKVVCMDPATEKWYTEEIKQMEKSDKEIRDQIDDVKRDLSGINIIVEIHIIVNLYKNHDFVH